MGCGCGGNGDHRDNFAEIADYLNQYREGLPVGYGPAKKKRVSLAKRKSKKLKRKRASKSKNKKK